MSAFDAGIGGVAVRPHALAGAGHAEQSGERGLGARASGFVVTTRFESRQQRASAVHVIGQLARLRIGQRSRVGEDQPTVAAERIRREIVFVNEVEDEAAVEQGIVHSLQEVGNVAAAGRLVERVGALREHDRKIRDGLFDLEVGRVGGDPLVEAAAGLFPAVIFRFTAEPVIPGCHAAGRGLSHPHGGFERSLGGVPPQRVGVGVRAGHIGDRAALHHSAGDPAHPARSPRAVFRRSGPGGRH